MSVRDRLIQLTLRARNFLSGDVAPATESMRELAEEGRKLKASMEDVGRARSLARTLRDNQQATEGLALAQADARATLEDLTRELGENATATAGQRIALREARRTLEEAEHAYKRNQQAIKNTTTELKNLGVDTDNVVAEERRLTDELDVGKKSLADNREAIKQKRIEEKKAAEVAKEHAERVSATSDAMANSVRNVLAFAAAYVSLNSVVGLVQKGLSLAASGIRAVITEGSEKQQALAQLEATLKSTGNAAGLTAQQLLDMADALEATSMLSAEQIQSAETRLLSYTDIAGKEFPRALQLVIDQQQRLGISVEQSAEIVGRALQSPAEAIATLGRQGFKLEDGQKRLLKQLEATGKKAEAQAIIMDMLTEAYGGSAASARMKTAAGLWKGLTDRFGDFASRVSNSGAFEFVQRKLLEVSDTLDEMASDGRLDRLAQGLSAAFIQGAERVEELARQLLKVDFKKLSDDSAAWLSQFGQSLDSAISSARLLAAPFRVAANVITGFIGSVGVAFTGLVATSLSSLTILARAWPDALGGKTLVTELEGARDKVFGLMDSLVKSVGRDGRDIKATWDSVAGSVEESSQRQVDAVSRAVQANKDEMQSVGDAILSHFRTNITSLENALAAISFAETTADLAEVEDGLRKSALAGDELTQAMDALQAKRGFVAVADDVTVAADTVKVALTDMASAMQLIESATQVRELELLREAMLDVYQDGRLSIEEYAQASGLLNKKLADLGGASASTARAVGGLASELKTLGDVQRAIASAKTDVEISSIRAALKKMFDTGVITAEQYNAEVKKAAERQRELKKEIDDGTKATKDRSKADKDAADQLRDETDDARQDAASASDFFGGVLSRAREPLAALSAAALDTFDKLRGIKNADIAIDTSSLGSTQESLERVSKALGEVQSAASRPMSSLGKWALEMQQSSLMTQKAFLGEKSQLQSLLQTYEQGGMSAQSFIKAATSARASLNLLDEADLSSLESAIQSAQQRMEQMASSTRSTLEGLQDELDKLQGREDDIERRRFSARQRELQAQLAEAQSGGDTNAVSNVQRALSLLKQVESESAQQRQREQQQKRIDNQKQSQPEPAAAQPSTIVRIEQAAQPPFDVSVAKGRDETALLSLLEDVSRRSR